MYHKTIATPPMIAIDKVKILDRLFDIKQSFFQLDLDEPNPEILLEVFEELLHLKPPVVHDQIDSYLESYKSELGNLASSNKEADDVSDISDDLSSSQIDAEELESENEDIIDRDVYLEAARVEAITQKMKDIGFESFSPSIIMEPTPEQIMVFITLLIHIYDEAYSRAQENYNSQILKSEERNGKRDTNSQWMAVHAQIAENEYRRDKLKYALENHRSKEPLFQQDLMQFEEARESMMQEYELEKRNTRIVADETEMLKRQIRALQDRMGHHEEEREKINQQLGFTLTRQEVEEISLNDQKTLVQTNEENAQLDELSMVLNKVHDELSGEEEWMKQSIQKLGLTNPIRRKVEEMVELIKADTGMQGDLDDITKEVKELEQQDLQLKQEYGDILRYKDHEHDGGNERSYVLGMKRQINEKMQRLDEMSTAGDQNNGMLEEQDEYASEQESIQRELIRGKERLNRNFDHDMLILKTLMDATISKALTSTLRHQNP